MCARTVFETSEVSVSPGGTYTVAVSSQTTGGRSGLSQAIVEYSDGGSGLIAFYRPRVSLQFVWRSERELLVRYPDDLPSPNIELTNSCFGRDTTVTYEAVARSQIKAMTWTRQGELRTLREERLERGVLVTIELDGRREYSYSYNDAAETDSSSDALQALGFHGGGCSWAGIVHGLVALRAPELLAAIELDPEADGLAVRSKRRAALQKVAKLVATAKKDAALLLRAIQQAQQDGQME